MLSKSKGKVKMLPLEGVRVLDLTMFWAGPAVTYVLGTLGAEVIKIEAIQRIDGLRSLSNPGGPNWWEKGAGYCGACLNKYGITVDLTQPHGKEVFKELVKIADVVIDNYTARVMRNFGFQYPALKEINPTIIQLSMPGFGATGPWRNFSAFAVNIEDVGGWAYITGYPNESPTPVRNSDPIQGYSGALALILALEHRRKTGQGQFIDVSQAEVLAACLGPAVIDYSLNGRSLSRMGNRHPGMAPHGCYPCKGEDEWVVIAIAKDDEWQRFCQATGHPEWGQDSRFTNLEGRLHNEGELNELVASWTRKHGNDEAMNILQRAKVAAGLVASAKDTASNPHLWERGFFQRVARDVIGTIPMPRLSFLLSKTPLRHRMAAPLLGEHNEYVLGEVLGLPDGKLQELEMAKITGKKPLVALD